MRPDSSIIVIVLHNFFFLNGVWGGLSHEFRRNPVIIESVQNHMAHNISIVGDEFVLDGKSLHILSGSLHYFRLPHQYWQDRLRKLKAAGLNAVSTYVEWSFHEQEEREYNFEGDKDLARFVRLAAEEGLYVLLRPGPYICAERDLGGFPYWLLRKYPNIELRTTDKDFMNESRIWLEKLFSHLKSLLYGKGGPIILVQVENEYGSYGNDNKYKAQSRDLLKHHVGENALLYTTDGSPYSLFRDGAVPGALTTIDFPSGYSVMETFKPLRTFMPHGPLMNSEYYTGWLTHWSESLQQIPTEQVIETLRSMVENKINVNFYVFFGGTNFEFSAGANYIGTYLPDITSYDYDAPLNEAGDPTPKYYAIRDLLEQYNVELEDIPRPSPSPKGEYGSVTVEPTSNILSPEGRATFGKEYNNYTGPELPTFESLGQRAGLMLYETTLNSSDAMLHIARPRDRIYVYVNGDFKGLISRQQKLFSLPMSSKPGSTLSLLVENQGRINFGKGLHDFKGIRSPVKYNGETLAGLWKITGYPLDVLKTTSHNSQNVPTSEQKLKSGPVLYEGQFTLPNGQTPLDTFLDTTGWGKGYVWVNGYNLGRYWPAMGPQVTLYVPGVWLFAAPAQNILEILELEEAPSNLKMEFISYPILNRTGVPK